VLRSGEFEQPDSRDPRPLSPPRAGGLLGRDGCGQKRPLGGVASSASDLPALDYPFFDPGLSLPPAPRPLLPVWQFEW